MKHCKVEFDDNAYEVVREAAYRDRTPIRRWVEQIAAQAAAQRTGLPLPAAPAAEGTGADSREGQP